MRPRLAYGFVGALVFLLLVAALSGIQFGDRTLFPTRDPEAEVIFLVSNRFHSGLVLPTPAVKAVATQRTAVAAGSVASRFASYDWIEVGWGDDRFYRSVPTTAEFDWRLALRALFRPGNPAVMHVVGVQGDPGEMFPGTDLVRLRLSPEGFRRLVSAVDQGFARDAGGAVEDLGPGLYGPSLFYRATGTFSLFNLCNHWTARMLGLAGVPVWPFAATLPRGLVLDLTLRSGLPLERSVLSVSGRTH